MSRKKKRKLNEISYTTNVVIIIFFGVFSLACILPFLTIVMSSITDEKVLKINGYSLFPEKISFGAYEYLMRVGKQIFVSFGVSIFVTVVGTFFSVFITAFYAYSLSRPNFKYRKFFNYLAFFTMLFGGGLVPTYLVVTKVVNIGDTIWALIFPLLLNVFFIIVMKTFFKTGIPDSIVEAAQIDGAGEIKTFIKIILPISLPSVATIALFTTLAYWNDWYNALLYIDSSELIPIQYMLMKIENNMEFLSQNASKMGMANNQAMIPAETSRMAIVVITTVPIACAYPFFQKYFVKGLTVGAVKE